MSRRVALLVSGASGMRLPLHLLGSLARHPEVATVHLVVSKGAALVLRQEAPSGRPGAEALLEGADLPPKLGGKVTIHRDGDLAAPIASGSYRLDGTVILPCSAATLGALATGAATTLIQRAGAVALKERWPLVLGFRETPLTVVHIANMRRLAHMGAVLLPPIPAFYIGGEDFGRFLDHYALRVLDQLGIADPGASGLRWGE